MVYSSRNRDRNRRKQGSEDPPRNQFEQNWLNLSQNTERNTEYNTFDPYNIPPTFSNSPYIEIPHTQQPYYDEMNLEYQAQIPHSDVDDVYLAYQESSQCMKQEEEEEEEEDETHDPNEEDEEPACVTVPQQRHREQREATQQRLRQRARQQQRQQSGASSLLSKHQKSCQDSQFGVSSSAVSQVNPILKKNLIEYFVSTDQSFSHIESQGFVRFMSYVLPGVQIMSRKVLRSDILKWFLQEKEQMKAIITSGKYNVALTSDIWSGQAKTDYMSVVVHNIDDDWNLNKRIIAFSRIEGNHTSKNIIDIMVGVIEEWGLTNRIISVTLDNATADTVMIRDLKTRLNTEDTLLNQRCATHIINLIIQAGAVNYEPVINKIRSFINWINSSTTRVDKLKKRFRQNLLEERTFHLDNKIMWNSTYLMLTNFLSVGYVDVIIAYINNEYGDGSITTADIRMAESFVSFLDIFYKETCYLSSCYKPTSQFGFHTMAALSIHFEKYRDDPIFERCIQDMEVKFLKYWGPGNVPLLFGFGAILDVRTKIRGLKMFCEFLKLRFGGQQDYVSLDLPRIVEAFYALFRVYETKLNPQYRTQASQETQYPRRHQFANVFNNDLPNSPSPPHEIGTSTARRSQDHPRTHPEILMYDNNEWVKNDDEGLDLLFWWRQNAKRFPILSTMAQDILSIPVSTVSSEAAFSSVGRVIDDRRCSLKPEIMEALTCGKDWIQYKNRAQETYHCFDIFDDFDFDFASLDMNN